MAQRIIVIHGRHTKPAKAPHAELLKKSLISGLSRVDKAKAKKVQSGKIPVEFVYYGDVNNELLSTKLKIRKTLSAKDPDCANAPCLPHEGYQEAIDRLGEFSKFSKSAYHKTLKENKDFRWLDDAARAFSTLTAIASASRLNMKVIAKATEDMGAYLLTRKVGSKVRQRLQEPLKAAILRGDDICLISHSMGCMVAYDVMWKFSQMSEYSDVQASGNKVNLWMTLGCPLGEAGVKRNLYDGDERKSDKHPRKIIKDWVNVAAKDDFVAHDSSMKDDYRGMLTNGYIDSITDKKIYNCFAYKGKSNPHKSYGYLAHTYVGMRIAEWIK